jgi:hydroxyacylglutathione hydrolase
MILRRLYNDHIAQASYLVGCDTTRQALVVDPTLDLAQYVDAAAAEGLNIACVTETHIHADFVSGARALAALTGARLALPHRRPARRPHAAAARRG